MKSPQYFAILSLAITGLAPLPIQAADLATDMLKEARAALQRGDLDIAKAKLETVRSVDPKNPAALAMLRQIQTQQTMQGGAGTEATLAHLIVPKIEFRDAQLSAIFPALRQQADRLTGGKIVPNFVPQLSEDQANAAISLNLTNVPFTEILRYIGSLANVTFVYDKYAILVRPTAGSAKADAPSPTEAAK